MVKPFLFNITHQNKILLKSNVVRKRVGLNDIPIGHSFSVKIHTVNGYITDRMLLVIAFKMNFRHGYRFITKRLDVSVGNSFHATLDQIV